MVFSSFQLKTLSCNISKRCDSLSSTSASTVILTGLLAVDDGRLHNGREWLSSRILDIGEGDDHCVAPAPATRT
jgi:hypothetical protein